jgi:hypothetical protein
VVSHCHPEQREGRRFQRRAHHSRQEPRSLALPGMTSPTRESRTTLRQPRSGKKTIRKTTTHEENSLRAMSREGWDRVET